MATYFKYINFPIFLISFCIGVFFVYVTMPDMRKIYVYPTPENVAVLQYRDNTGSCFEFTQKEVACPRDESKIKKIPVQ
jgi:hypothetical protein